RPALQHHALDQADLQARRQRPTKDQLGLAAQPARRLIASRRHRTVSGLVHTTAVAPSAASTSGAGRRVTAGARTVAKEARPAVATARAPRTKSGQSRRSPVDVASQTLAPPL